MLYMDIYLLNMMTFYDTGMLFYNKLSLDRGTNAVLNTGARNLFNIIALHFFLPCNSKTFHFGEIRFKFTKTL